MTLAETTPVLEAAELSRPSPRRDRALRMGGERQPCSGGPTGSPTAARAAAELEQIEFVKTTLATRVAVVPWLAEEPRGPDRLRQILQPVGAA